jgi:hypothetical protein
MHPELEDFLEEAFDPIQATSAEIGRVVVEPDYDTAPDPGDSDRTRQELQSLLALHKSLDEHADLVNGVTVEIGQEQMLLKKYLRKITLHADAVDGPWVEVAPPGNWI